MYKKFASDGFKDYFDAVSYGSRGVCNEENIANYIHFDILVLGNINNGIPEFTKAHIPCSYQRLPPGLTKREKE